MKLKFTDKPIRLDNYLRKKYPGAQLSTIYTWIRKGKVKVNEKKKSESYKLQKDDKLEMFFAPDVLQRFSKDTVNRWDFKVLYEDEELLIINKPPFLASQPGMGVMKNNVVNQVKYYLNQPTKTVALANRLDKETSGIIVVGKNRIMNGKLYDVYKQRRVAKYYLALVVGRVPKKKGVWRNYLRKTKKNFQHMSVVTTRDDEKGESAETEYKVKKYYGNYTLLELKLNTGRMHQIRVQAASRGFPVLCDKIYGERNENKKWRKYLKRHFLHATALYLMHPTTNKPLKIEAPLSDDLKKVLEKM